jgi:hypothetical protein
MPRSLYSIPQLLKISEVEILSLLYIYGVDIGLIGQIETFLRRFAVTRELLYVPVLSMYYRLIQFCMQFLLVVCWYEENFCTW